MPNWVLNRLEVRGTEDDLNMFRQVVASENKPLDFNQIIPEPDWEWGIKTIDKYTKRSNFVCDAVAEMLQKNFNEPAWFIWRIKNWGTMRCSEQGAEVKLCSDMLIYEFDTAWSAPLIVIYALIEQFPWLSFKLEYEEGNDCFYGQLAGENGEVNVEWVDEMTEETHPWWFSVEEDEVECQGVQCR